jgi:hypothetical protein
MVLLRRLSLLSLLVALLLSPPGVGTASGEGRAIVDETLVWNQVMLDSIVASNLGNPQTIRMAATVNTAMFDARNGIGSKYTPIFVTRTAPPGTHRRAAVVQAAYVTLKAFYPAQVARFDNQRALSLAEFTGDDPANVQRGVDWGESVANQVLAWRATDGFSNPVVPFNGAGAVIGQWESATGASLSPGSNIPFTAPFVLTSSTQFQSAFPRPWATLDSAAYAASFNEIATMGVKSGSRRTLDQTPKSEPRKAPLNLNDVARDVASFVRAELERHDVSLVLDVAPALPTVLGDRVQLQQVLLNLVMNGIEAMTSIMDRPRALVIGSRPHAGDQVLVAVQDTAVGIAPNHLDQLFSAFFTTKPSGMGMGLSISRSIIEAHGGRLWARPNETHGATFGFELPGMR